MSKSKSKKIETPILDRLEQIRAVKVAILHDPTRAVFTFPDGREYQVYVNYSDPDRLTVMRTTFLNTPLTIYSSASDVVRIK